MKNKFPRDASDLAQTMGRPLSPYRVDENGWTDLHYAAALNLPDSVRNLLVQGASVDAALAADGEQLDGLPLKVLRRYGFRFRTWEREGDQPLHLATWSTAINALCMLIDFGANVRARIRTGWTTLHVAARYNSVASATLLAAHGADVADQDRHGWTALHAAVRNDAFEMAEFLLDHGAAVDATEEHGFTPLHFAVIGDAPNTKDVPPLGAAAVGARCRRQRRERRRSGRYAAGHGRHPGPTRYGAIAEALRRRRDAGGKARSGGHGAPPFGSWPRRHGAVDPHLAPPSQAAPPFALDCEREPSATQQRKEEAAPCKTRSISATRWHSSQAAAAA